MIDIEREYVALSVSADSTAETQLLTRLVGSKGIRVGLDGGRGKHLLVPVEGPIKPDTSSRGVHLVQQELLHEDGVSRIYADLRCVEPRLDMVFDRLAQDVVAQAENSDHPSISVCRSVLEQWRELLRRGDSLTAEEIVGLIGELVVLRELALRNPGLALDAWVGPRRTVHDFVTSDRAIEVKASSSLEGTSVSIHGVDQLDPSDVEELFLVVVHCRPSDGAPNLDERLDELISLGVPREGLLRAVTHLGYVYEGPTTVSTRYRIISQTVWRVGDRFPGLRRSALDQGVLRGISNVRYTLSTDSAPRPLSDSEAAVLFEDWFTCG